MKYSLIALFLFVPLLLAQEKKEDEKPPSEGAKLLAELTMANLLKDVGRIDGVLKGIHELAETSKDQEAIDDLAKELKDSIKICKGNWGTLGKIVDTLGALRSKDGAKVLKRMAFKKKSKSEAEEKLQAKAIVSLGMMADTRQINGIGDMCKHKNVDVAKAAYTSFKYYGPAKGKTRKKVAEILMKRLEAEYPSTGGQGNQSVSAEKQERYNKVSAAIVASLQAVCRQTTINDIENWRQWWKENKKSAKAWRDANE